jgi:hypothetical protein
MSRTMKGYGGSGSVCEPVEDHLPHMATVRRNGRFPSGAAVGGDDRVRAAPCAVDPLDHGPLTHSGELVVQSTLLPLQQPGHVQRAQPAVSAWDSTWTALRGPEA